MSKRVKENYNKALKLYISGELNKALQVCEECISESLKFAPVLNLKGLILYQQGKLEEAITAWRINKEVNDDNLAKNYIKDSIGDEQRLEAYIKAKKCLERLEISDAIDLLLECKESDFNCIRVNTAIAFCFLKKGEYEMCRKYINKVLDVDKNCSEVLKIRKELNSVYKSGDKFRFDKRKMGITLSGVAIIFICIVSVNLIGKNEKNQSVEQFEKKVVTEKVEEKIEKEIDVKELKKDIERKNFDEIREKIKDIKVEELKTEEEKKAFEEGLKLLKKDGAVEFYKRGQELYNDKNLKEAREELIKGSIYGKEIYVYEHILYYLALTEEGLENIDDAIENLSIYEKEFAEGAYAEEVLYRLALLNDKKGNLTNAKGYAKKLKTNFTASIYNNTNMSKIMEK